MDLTPPAPTERNVVQRYGPGGVTINGALYRHSLIVTPEAVTPWPVRDLAEVAMDNLTAVTGAEPAIEVLLIGAGPLKAPPPALLRAGLRERGISCDIMAAAAACRTYNVLVAENRRVAAALIAPA